MFGVVIQQILAGFLVKSIASFDDTITGIPILIELTRTLKGKIAFSIGTLIALTVIVTIAFLFSAVLDLIPYSHQIIAFLIFLLALAVYFNLLFDAPQKRVEKKFANEQIEFGRLLRLFFIGFIISFVTLSDDMIILVPLFVGHGITRFYSLIGVYLAAFVEIFIIIYFSKQLERIKFKKELASLSLIILSLVVWFEIL